MTRWRLAGAIVAAATATAMAACSGTGGSSRPGAGGSGQGGSGQGGSGQGATGGIEVTGGSAGTGGAASTGGSGGTGAGGTGGSSGFDGGFGGGFGGAGGSGAGGSVTDGCATQDFKAEPTPLDVYVMFDQSLSMTTDAGGISRWNAVKAAMQAFLTSPDSAGIGVGMQFFGLGGLLSSCNAADYANPATPIAPLPGNANALIAALGSHGPVSTTPTFPAVAGAVQYAKAWRQAHPTHITLVLLVTDGEPDTCGTLAQAVNAAAAGASGTPQIPTFVLGVGPSLNNLNQIASAGGSQAAYIVSGGTNVTQQVIDALNKIRGSAVLPCEYQIPTPTAGQTVDFSKVNVKYTSSGGQASFLGQVNDAGSCDPQNGGWYYDNAPPATPTAIELCPTTCNAVTSGKGGMQIALGCDTYRGTVY